MLTVLALLTFGMVLSLAIAMVRGESTPVPAPAPVQRRNGNQPTR
jgi:hypothetical protein